MTEEQQEELNKFEREIENDPKAPYAPCRNCERTLRKKLRRCPYCGILNPTVTVKEIFITMAGVLIVMGIVTSFIK